MFGSLEFLQKFAEANFGAKTGIIVVIVAVILGYILFFTTTVNSICSAILRLWAFLDKKEETKHKKKEDTIKELERLKECLDAWYAAIYGSDVGNESNLNELNSLLEKYAWLIGKLETKHPKKIRERLNEIIGVMKTYDHKTALLKLEAEKPV